MNTSTLVQKVWNFCQTLHDDGVGYGDYLKAWGLFGKELDALINEMNVELVA